MSAKKLPCRNGKVRWEKGSSNLRIYQKDTDTVHVLNETGALVWSLLDGKHTVGQIEREVRKAFLIEDERDVRTDVQGLVEELRGKGLLEE
jgi:hypothetical protein